MSTERMGTNSQPQHVAADRSQAEEAARGLSRAVGSGDHAGAAEALRALARTLEGARNGPAAADTSHENDVAPEGFDPARGLTPARNPAFAQARRRRDRGALWSRAVIGIAIAGAAAWWFALHPPRHQEGAVIGAPAKESEQSAARPAHQTPAVRAAEAEILESQVMALAAAMPAPAMPTTVIPPERPAIAEKGAAPEGATGTTTAPTAGFSSIAGLITQWQNEQAQLVAAERSLAAGRTAEARRLIEAVQTQIVLQPVTPENPRPSPDNNGTAAQLGRTLRLMDAGEEELARRTLHHAIEDLRSRFPAAGALGAG